MKRSLYIAILLFIATTYSINGQSRIELENKIRSIAADKQATVGVAIEDGKGRQIVTLNGEKRFPLQSVFKLHIGLYMLSQIDKGKYSLEQKVEIKKSELLPDLYSPIRDKYPDGVTLTIGEILEYTISQSDNVGCDLLLKLIGGPKAVERYFVKNGYKNTSIKHNEETQQSKWELQFDNWTTPKTANKILRDFYENKKKFLSQKSYDFFWKTMRDTTTGANRIKGELPENTIVAHKTGTSGVNEATGITAAVNDMGVVFLPDGERFYITVFVTESKENAETNEKIIAEIAKAAWDHFAKASK